MDYNIYVAQSGGVRGDEAHFNHWEEEVYQTYLKYFKANYLGNRAPLDIGHHFSLWNGGIYWKAMKRFAQTVCSQPEVVCGNYTEMLNFLESKNQNELNDFQNGSFPKMKSKNVADEILNAPDVDWADEVLTPEVIKELESQACPPEAHQ